MLYFVLSISMMAGILFYIYFKNIALSIIISVLIFIGISVLYFFHDVVTEKIKTIINKIHKNSNHSSNRQKDMNKNEFRYRIVGAIIALVVAIIVLIFLGTAIVNHNLKLDYENNIEKYTENLETYNNALGQYNAQVEAANQYNESGIVPVNVSVSSVQTNDQKIGNEIYYIYKINDQEISNSDTIKISVKTPTTFFSYVEDNAEKYPDRGSVTDQIQLTLEDLMSGYTLKQQMSAHETYGKFAGNTATFETTYKLNIDPNFTTEITVSEPNEPAKPVLVQIKKRELIGNNIPATIVLILMIIAFIVFVTLCWTDMYKSDEREKTKISLKQEYDRGFQDGKNMLKSEIKEHEQNGYDRGYNKGYAIGKKEGKEIGYKKGRKDGYEEGREDGIRIQLSTFEVLDLPDPEEGYIANSTSKKFHRINCKYASDIGEQHAIHFSSRKEAIEAGYKSCGKCKP